jgi:SAM-dependent methyltransferase
MTLSPTWNVTCPPLSKVCRLGGAPDEQSFKYSGRSSVRQRKTHKNWAFFDIFRSNRVALEADFLTAPPRFSTARPCLSAYPKRGCAPPRRFSPKLVLAAAAALLTWILAGSAGRPISAQSLAPYIPSPEDVVDRMLAFAKVTGDDVVYDLGCGDGRIPIAAARKYGARGVGFDIDPALIELAKANARVAGVEGRVDFRVQNVLTADVSKATVVTLFLLSSSNERLRPILTQQLQPGARIVSHAFSMGRDWPADAIDQFVSARGDEVTLYLWRIK